jgi:cytoskeletal protein CcmA (bactofilin family)
MALASFDIKNRSELYFASQAAGTTVFPWGVYSIAKCTAGSSGQKLVRQAIVGSKPSQSLSFGLVFRNQSHQLVMTGTASVAGDALLGLSGAAVGHLNEYSSPVRLPIRGQIQSIAEPRLPRLRLNFLEGQIQTFSSMLGKAAFQETADSNQIVGVGGAEGLTNALNAVGGNATQVYIAGDAILTSPIVRREKPLTLVVTGSIRVKNGGELDGLITVIAGKTISVDSGARIEHALLYANNSIVVKRGAKITSQLISPTITLEQNAYAVYPSAVVSLSDGHSAHQRITISSGAKVEGFVALIDKDGEDALYTHIIDIQPTAQIVGAVYCNTAITLDGNVFGSVFTTDFYFYQAPTKYLGWLRSGVIDRSKLPSGYLLPVGFGDEPNLDILEWL